MKERANGQPGTASLRLRDYVISETGSSALASTAPPLSASERRMLEKIAAGRSMRSAEAVRLLAQLHDRGLVNARSWQPLSVDSDDSRLDSEAAKAVGQLRRTGLHISFARQMSNRL